MNNDIRKFDVILGVDWGEKRIGLSLGYRETGMATPYGTVKNINEIIEIIKTEEVELIVVGKPLSITNYELRNSDFEKFINDLEKASNLPLEMIDERLSSKAADSLVGGKKEKAGRDEIAAMIILQSFMDMKGISKA